MSNLNLLTQEEKTEQLKVRVVKMSTIITLVLLVLTVIVSGYFYLKATNLKNQLQTAEQRVSSARSNIESMKSVEIYARNLYKKYLVLVDILEEKVYYSEFLSAYNSRIPSGVTTDNFSFSKGDEIGLRGAASNYLLVSDLLANLNDDSIDKIFEDAYLRSAKLNPGSSTVDFDVVASYDSGVLKRGFR